MKNITIIKIKGDLYKLIYEKYNNNKNKRKSSFFMGDKCNTNLYL